MNEEWAAVRDGAAAPEEFVRLANVAAREGDFESIYDAARARCWSLVRAGANDVEGPVWAKAIQRVRALCLGFADPQGSHTAARLETIGDLLADTIQFAEQHSKGDVLQRAHVRKLLNAIASQGGRVRRSKLLALTKLSNPNLSRVLNVLEGNALIKRAQIDGREVEIALSDEGVRVTTTLPQEESGEHTPTMLGAKITREHRPKLLGKRFKMGGKTVLIVDKGSLEARPVKTRRLRMTSVQGISQRWRAPSNDPPALSASQ